MKYRESDVDKKLRGWFSSDLSRGLLKSIELRKGALRGLRTFAIDFEYPITAIAGRNGAGKSTVLALACCAYHIHKTAFKLKRRRFPYYTFSDFFVQHSEEIPPQGIEIFYKMAYNNWKKSDVMPTGEGVAYQKRWKRKGGKWNDYAGRVKRNVVYLGIDRIVPHSERSQSKSYSKVFKSTEPLGWETKVKEIVGYILGKKYEKLRYLEYSIYNLPIVEVDGLKYSGLNMGAGENALFEIFRIIHSCADGALLVIDEIELGLHIDAQRKLIKKLKEACLEKKIQIICTTHSKEIFNTLPPDARRYIECINGTTVLTSAISSDFAMAKMGAIENKEIDILLEDGIAIDILTFALPTNIRSRIRTIPIGSASALSRQLAAAYARKDDRQILAIFDGDQRPSEADNLKHAKNTAELTDNKFDQWFKSHIDYLPGETWPEVWLIQKNLEHLSSLSELTLTDESSLVEIMEYGLQAGKHNEFHEISGHLGLEKRQCIQYFVMNIQKHDSAVFQTILEKVTFLLDI